MIQEDIRPARHKHGDEQAREWDRAYNDALRSMLSEPDPAEIEPWLKVRQSAAIFGAANRGGLHITEPHCRDEKLMRDLRMAGLVEVRGNYLTARGIKVRRVIVGRSV